jgi:hypothetical protein
MADGEHLVKTAQNGVVNTEGSGTITVDVNWPNVKTANIILRHVLYVPGSGTNNFLSIILIMRRAVNFKCKHNGETSSLGSLTL